MSAHLEMFALLGITALILGATLVALGRGARPGRAAVTLLLVLVVGATLFTASSASAAQAASSPCSTSADSDDRLTVTQTSTMTGLAPGVAPAPITGRLMNLSGESTHVSVVEVHITSITAAPGAPVGACKISDYLLAAPRMRVARTLTPGGATTFSGAGIGFSNKAVNQDHCQGATVHLSYTANPR